jgi:type IV pilus assembly protein PilC
MVSVGEQTGALDDILQQIAEFYEEDVDQTMTSLPSIIEPVLILVLGVGVGGLAMAIIMPMYSMMDKF